MMLSIVIALPAHLPEQRKGAEETFLHCFVEEHSCCTVLAYHIRACHMGRGNS